MSRVENEDGWDDDFGGFGDETNYDEEEFGDFSESKITELQASPVKTSTIDNNANKQGFENNLKVDSILSQTAALLDASINNSARNEVVEKCIAQILDDIPESSHTVEPQDRTSENPLLDPSAADSFVSDVMQTVDHASIEPRLLRNLLFVAVSGISDPRKICELLTPLSELQLPYKETNPMAQDAPPLSIEEIQAIISVQESQSLLDSQATDLESTLEHALQSIDVLIAAKEQELAKKKDAIDAYNQVIQTLVAQATKLH
ncbi:hypothetical protein BX070DRAFT_221768 [Coemansia spiralis]|nr:hypothetical protein BX070DRAFT_221768 [Coemansia spiralis]